MEFLEVPLYDDDIFKLGVRFLLNITFLTLIVRFGISPNNIGREFKFTAVMMNVTAFFICFSLKKLELELGMALGLFAIFGVLRYRTDAIRTKEMTYLFILIGIAVINALSNRKTSYTEILAINLAILGATLLKERLVRNGAEKLQKGEPPKPARKQRKFDVEYDRLECLGAAQEPELIADLVQRTGVDVARVQVKSVNLSQKTAILTVWAAPAGTAID